MFCNLNETKNSKLVSDQRLKGYKHHVARTKNKQMKQPADYASMKMLTEFISGKTTQGHSIAAHCIANLIKGLNEKHISPIIDTNNLIKCQTNKQFEIKKKKENGIISRTS